MEPNYKADETVRISTNNERDYFLENDITCVPSTTICSVVTSLSTTTVSLCRVAGHIQETEKQRFVFLCLNGKSAMPTKY